MLASRGGADDGDMRSCVHGLFFFFQAEDGIRDLTVTGVQTCALPIYVAIDRLVADREPAVTAEPARHLLRTPILPQELLDLRPLSGRELPIASGVRADRKSVV